jgi:hypothetical protein
VLLTIALTGCYASTEPAINVGPESATLRATGTANSGAAVSWFLYGKTGTGNRTSDVGYRHWPAGASGSWSYNVAPLNAATSYSFQICGYDVNRPDPECSSARTFTTAVANQDAALGSWGAPPSPSEPPGSSFYGEVKAHSDPGGAHPTGYVSDVDPNGTSPFSFKGFVTCLAVDGNRAAVGAVGQQTFINDGTKRAATVMLTIIDSAGTDSDYIALDHQPGSTPPNCTTATFSKTFVYQWNTFAVNDAPTATR